MPESDLDLLFNAAKSAGKIALKHFRNRPEVWEKGDGQGPVSQADLEINDMLLDRLRNARPDYGWLSEETEDGQIRLDRDYVFIVDPIDGTRSFIQGHHDFGISLAVARQGQIIAGVVLMPARGLTYSAVLGGGALMNGQQIRANGVNRLENARMLAAKAQMKPEFWRREVPPIDRHFRSSIAFRLCLVAQGRFDGMFTFRPVWEWDAAAGSLICSEAGAEVSNAKEEPVAFNNPTPKLNGLVVTTQEIHKPFMSYVA